MKAMSAECTTGLNLDVLQELPVHHGVEVLVHLGHQRAMNVWVAVPKIRNPNATDGIEQGGAVLQGDPRTIRMRHLQSQRVQGGGGQSLAQKWIFCVRHAAKVVSVGNLHHDLVKECPARVAVAQMPFWNHASRRGLNPHKTRVSRLSAGKGFHLHHFVSLA